MNEHFKIEETVKYHIEYILDDDEPFVTGDFSIAKQCFGDGALVEEHHFVKYRSEWSRTENHFVYDWHQ